MYDLSNGMAAQFSRQLIGKHIEGVWHTGIVVYGKEYYFGGGISYDAPARTPFGRINQVLTFPCRKPYQSFRSWFHRVRGVHILRVLEGSDSPLHSRDIQCVQAQLQYFFQ